jgi:hypothetical protein
MEGAFVVVLFVVVGVAVVAALISLVASGPAYREIGRGGMSIGDESQAAGRGAAAPAGAAVTPGQAAEREAEVRQMLEARNARRAARGQPTGDVEAELSALLRPAAEPGIEAEVRQLVESRNARRVERGQEPLDVDAEVRRRLEGLGG